MLKVLIELNEKVYLHYKTLSDSHINRLLDICITRYRMVSNNKSVSEQRKNKNKVQINKTVNEKKIKTKENVWNNKAERVKKKDSSKTNDFNQNVMSLANFGKCSECIFLKRCCLVWGGK